MRVGCSGKGKGGMCTNVGVKALDSSQWRNRLWYVHDCTLIRLDAGSKCFQRDKLRVFPGVRER